VHLDYLADKVRAFNPSARVVGAPGAGFFMDLPSFSGTYEYRANYQWVATHNLTTNAACVNALPVNDTWMCFVAPYVLPYIQTPIFIMNSLADAWQVCGSGGRGVGGWELGVVGVARASVFSLSFSRWL
jgi:hypothetical protein